MKNKLLKIAKYLYSKQLFSYNIKSLSNRIQNYYLNQESSQHTKHYKDLTEEEKLQLNDKISQMLDSIQSFIKATTNNIQYQNWLCNVIKNGDIPLDNFVYQGMGQNEYFEQIKQIFDNFNLIKKVSTDNKKNNINNFKSLDQLNSFVAQQMKNNQQAVRKKIVTTDISKLFSKQNYGKYDLYYLDRADMLDFQKIYGSKGYGCAWCVANDASYYAKYVQSGYLYLITYANTSKPYALLSLSNYNNDDGIEFRDIHNSTITDYDQDISKMIIDTVFNQYAQSGYDVIVSVYNYFDESVLPKLNRDFINTLVDSQYEKLYVQILDDKYKRQLFMTWAQTHQNRKLINAIQDHVFLQWNELDQQFLKCLAKNNCAFLLIDIILNGDGDIDEDQANIIIGMYLKYSSDCGYLLKLIKRYAISSLCFTIQQIEYLLTKCENEYDKIIVLNTCSDKMLNHKQLVAVSNLAKQILINWIKTKNNVLKNQGFKKQIASDKLSLFHILFDCLDQNLKQEYKEFVYEKNTI